MLTCARCFSDVIRYLHFSTVAVRSNLTEIDLIGSRVPPEWSWSAGLDYERQIMAHPVSLAQCTYVPEPGYDPLVKHLCLNPKGSLPNGSPAGEFTIRMRARIR